MERCTSILIDIFQDIDALSLFSQLLLEDLSLSPRFNMTKDEKLVFLMDQFCDWTLKSLRSFLENRKVVKKAGEC